MQRKPLTKFNIHSWLKKKPPVQFSRSVMSNSLQPHELQHVRPPCPSPTPRVHPNSCPSSWCCHPAISSSVVPFSSCPQSFLASGCFQMSQLLSLGGQSIGVSASASLLPMNIQDWFPLGWTGWFSLQFKGLSHITVFSSATVQKDLFFYHQFSSVHFSCSVMSSSLHQVAKVLEFQFQRQSFQWTPRTDLL